MSHGGNKHKWGADSDYMPGYRRWVAEQVAVQGKTCKQVATEQGLDVGLVAGWNGAYREGHYAGFVAAPFPKKRGAVQRYEHVAVALLKPQQAGITVQCLGSTVVIPPDATPELAGAVVAALRAPGRA